MKRLLITAMGAMLATTAMAQDDAQEYAVVLPDAAQQCVLPASPDAIPDQASYDDLVKAKGQIGEFQSAIEVYRECLRQAEDLETNTAGNKQAIVSSFNYTVEMEERVAERFNVAVRDYKARKAAESEG